MGIFNINKEKQQARQERREERRNERNKIGTSFTVSNDSLASEIDSAIENYSSYSSVLDTSATSGFQIKTVSDFATPITASPLSITPTNNYSSILDTSATSSFTPISATPFANQSKNSIFANATSSVRDEIINSFNFNQNNLGINDSTLSDIYQCEYVDVLTVVEYIKKEIEVNANSAICKRINFLNNQFWTGLAPFVMYKLEAYNEWKNMVGKNKAWDHKSTIRQSIYKNKEWACDKTKFNGCYLKFNFDIWSNIHYGYVGKKAGFTEFELLNGAGFAQISDNNKPLDRWETWKEYIKNRTIDIGDADILGGFDDPKDQQAIKVGFKLYNNNSYNFPSEKEILDELYSVYSSRKPINIEECKDHK